MNSYYNRNSGIRGYSFGATYITIRFKTGRTYTYSYSSCSVVDVENMKMLALAQSGLNSYINVFRPRYEGQERAYPSDDSSYSV